MSRSGYTDDWDCDRESMWRLMRWRGAVKSALRGERGQAFLRDLRDALDAMPVKKLIYGKLIDAEGAVCALGAIGQARGLPLTELEALRNEREEEDDIDYANHHLSDVFDVAHALICELQFENDEAVYFVTDNTADAAERRWRYVRNWTERNIKT